LGGDLLRGRGLWRNLRALFGPRGGVFGSGVSTFVILEFLSAAGGRAPRFITLLARTCKLFLREIDGGEGLAMRGVSGRLIEAAHTKSKEGTMSKFTLHDHNDDGINRRGFLECMAWAGTGVVRTVVVGVLSSRAFAKPAHPGEAKGEMTFVQISDSHIGFNKPANPDVVRTLQATVDKINALP
jgi:hypothetical protein